MKPSNLRGIVSIVCLLSLFVGCSRSTVPPAATNENATIDEDLDHDGLANIVDNCPMQDNADQADSNADGIGDACTTVLTEEVEKIVESEKEKIVTVLTEKIIEVQGSAASVAKSRQWKMEWVAGNSGGWGDLAGGSLEGYVRTICGTEPGTPLPEYCTDRTGEVHLGRMKHAHPDVPHPSVVGGVGGMAIANGLLYIATYHNNKIHVYDPARDWLSEYAGDYRSDKWCNNGPAATATFRTPYDISATPDGAHLYVADKGNHAIRRITTATQQVETISPTCNPEVSGNVVGAGKVGRLNHPNAVQVDAAKRVYVADQWSNTIKRILADGTYETFHRVSGTLWDLALEGDYLYFSITIQNVGSYIRRIQVSARDAEMAKIVAGTKSCEASGGAWDCATADNEETLVQSGHDLPSCKIPGMYATGIAIADGALFFTNDNTKTVLALDLASYDADPTSTPQCVVLAGGGASGSEAGFRDGPCAEALFPSMTRLATDGDHVYVSSNSHSVRKIVLPHDGEDPTECLVSTIIGAPESPLYYNTIDPSTVIPKPIQAGEADQNNARFNRPLGISVMPDGDLLVADYTEHRIRRVHLAPDFPQTGHVAVSTVAGRGQSVRWIYIKSNQGAPIIDGARDNASFVHPRSIAISGDGKYAVVSSNATVLRLVLVDRTAPNYGETHTIAGVCERNPPGNDTNACKLGMVDGVGEEARFSALQRMTRAEDAVGHEVYYVVDQGNVVIRMVRPIGDADQPTTASFDARFEVTTPYGVPGTAIYRDGVGTAATFLKPHAITFAKTGQGRRYLFVSDNGGSMVRQIDLDTDEVTTICGQTSAGFVAGACVDAQFGTVVSLSARVIPTDDPTHDDRILLYALDNYYTRVHEIDVTAGTTRPIAGSSTYATIEGVGAKSSFVNAYDIVYHPQLDRLFMVDFSDRTVLQLIPIDE